MSGSLEHNVMDISSQVLQGGSSMIGDDKVGIDVHDSQFILVEMAQSESPLLSHPQNNQCPIILAGMSEHRKTP